MTLVSTFQYIKPITAGYTVPLNINNSNYSVYVFYDNYADSTQLVVYDPFGKSLRVLPIIIDLDILFGLGLNYEFILDSSDNLFKLYSK